MNEIKTSNRITGGFGLTGANQASVNTKTTSSPAPSRSRPTEQNMPLGRNAGATSTSTVRPRAHLDSAQTLGASPPQKKMTSRSIQGITKMIERSSNPLTLELANRELQEAGFAPLSQEGIEKNKATRERRHELKVRVGLGTMMAGALLISAPLMGANMLYRTLNGEREFVKYMKEKYADK